MIIKANILSFHETQKMQEPYSIPGDDSIDKKILHATIKKDFTATDNSMLSVKTVFNYYPFILL